MHVWISLIYDSNDYHDDYDDNNNDYNIYYYADDMPTYLLMFIKTKLN